MSEPMTKENQRPATLIEELRLEAALVPHRRGKIYDLAADEIERLSAARESRAEPAKTTDPVRVAMLASLAQIEQIAEPKNSAEILGALLFGEVEPRDADLWPPIQIVKKRLLEIMTRSQDASSRELAREALRYMEDIHAALQETRHE